MLLEGELLAFGLGAGLAWLVAQQRALRRRLDDAERELGDLRSQAVRTTVQEPARPAAEVPPPLKTADAAPGPAPQRLESERLDADRPPPLPPTYPQPATPQPATPRQTAPQPAATSSAERPPAATPPPPSPTLPAVPREPSAMDRALGAIKAWFTEGNVPVKIGVLVLFAGVAAALRFAAAEGYFTFPVGWRLSLIAAGALVGLGLGWRERTRRPAFGISLQGGAIGVLLLTVFASYRLYDLLPAGMAFAMVVVLVGGAALLAVLQRAMTLATLGFLGGYLAPVLLSTGSGNHVALFSYYAVLNAAVLAISWRQHWRLLNLIGFLFTFGVGSIWFSRSYQPDLFWTVEPFLVLFFLFYVAIGLLYAWRKSETRRPWLDGTLVFGTPLVTFPMQAVLLKDEPMALAFSAIAVAGLYAGLLYWLRTQRQERLLTDAYGALALGFATLAVPLAFSASTTTSLWALEGAAVAWMGLRQNRTFTWLSGLALQPLAAIAFLISEGTRSGNHDWLLLNGTWLGAAMLGFAGVALAYVFDRYKPLPVLPAFLMSWGLGWWTLAGLTQVEEVDLQIPGGAAEWQFGVVYLACSLLLAGISKRYVPWPRMGWAMVLWTVLSLPCVPWASDALGDVFTGATLPVWLGYFMVWCGVLWLHRGASERSVSWTHGLGLWLFAFATTLHIYQQFLHPSGWQFLATVAPLGLLTLGLWRRPRWFAWPRAEDFATHRDTLWFGLALPLFTLFWLVGLFDEGFSDPLPYLPLLNPLELGLAGIALLVWAYWRSRLPDMAAKAPIWVGTGFLFLTLATLRAVFHLHGEAWSTRILDSGFAQTSLTVVWSLLGVSAWIIGSRWGRRPLWLAGAGLMGLVLVKLILVDRQYMGNIPGIVSFLAVGLLLVVVGYFAPSPAQAEESK